MPAKKKTKRKATPAQLRALAKGRAALKKKRAKMKPKRRAKKRTVKKRVAKRRPSRVATHKKARTALRKGVNPVKPSSRARPHWAIKQVSTGRFYDGAGFTQKRAQAAMWMDLSRCKNVAQKLADATGKQCEIVH